MTLICFVLTFYSPKRKKLAPDKYEIPKGDIYEVFREDIIGWTQDVRSMPRDIICKVLRDIHLPVWLFYPFIRLGARIFGGFNLEEVSAESGVQKCNIPIIFIHGEGDDFVPCDMSRRLYSTCTSEHKKLYTVSGVGHGLAFPADKDGYYGALREFENESGAFT